MSPEFQWVLACVRALQAQMELPPPGAVDWNVVLAVAEAEGVAPALGFAFRRNAPAAMPAAVRERLRLHLADRMAGHLILTRELGRLLRSFERAGVPVIPLKGPLLAETLYSDPALRPSSDLDLLVRPETLLTVDRLLGSLGYRRVADDHSWNFDLAYDRATLYAGAGGVHVDLHWSLLSEPRFAWNEPAGLTVWDRVIPVEIPGARAQSLCPEDLLLYLAVHLAAHHGLTGLLWHWDLALILDRWHDRLDWRALIARARAWRVRTALYFSLRGCERLFGASVPAWAMSQLEARGARAAALGWLTRHREGERLTRLEHLIALLLVDRGRDLGRPLAHVLCPSPAWLRARYDGEGASLLAAYLAHFRRMAHVTRRMKEGLAPAQRSADR